MSNPTLKLLPALMIAIAALVTQPVRATALNSIIITENSSTSLSATYRGSTTGVTVNFVGTDSWNVTFPSTVTFSLVGGVNWLEPENSSLGNEVTFFTPPLIATNWAFLATIPLRAQQRLETGLLFTTSVLIPPTPGLFQ